jgi:hypothetical protein
MREWEKAGYIVHEFRHSRQNPVKAYKTALLNAVTGHTHDYSTCPLEGEAFLYERFLYQALYVEPPEDVDLHLYRYAMGDDTIEHQYSLQIHKDFGED